MKDKEWKVILDEFVNIQCENGNWNYDPYMHGMTNGLIFAQSVLKDIEPKYLNAPEKWLYRKSIWKKIVNFFS